MLIPSILTLHSGHLHTNAFHKEGYLSQLNIIICCALLMSKVFSIKVDYDRQFPDDI
jgi:hypothetical protein